jgi:hypothetical protein
LYGDADLGENGPQGFLQFAPQGFEQHSLLNLHSEVEQQQLGVFEFFEKFFPTPPLQSYFRLGSQEDLKLHAQSQRSQFPFLQQLQFFIKQRQTLLLVLSEVLEIGEVEPFLLFGVCWSVVFKFFVFGKTEIFTGDPLEFFKLFVLFETSETLRLVAIERSFLETGLKSLAILIKGKIRLQVS